MTAPPSTDLDAIGARARVAADALAVAGTTAKNDALRAAADALASAKAEVLAANAEDVDAGRSSGLSATLVDRLTLTANRIDGMVEGLLDVAALPDPVGEVIEGWRRPSGLELRKVRVPIGVVAVIYEARPNVTSDVAGLCLKSGNASLLRCSSQALRSSVAIVESIRAALTQSSVPEDSVQLITDTTRDAAVALMRLREHVDLLVPRGGRSLIDSMIENASVPYVIDGDGNCHVYVDAAADLDKAHAIVLNAKLSRPSVCNSAEKLLVHQEIAAKFLPGVCRALEAAGCSLRGDDAARALVPSMDAATDADWATEYLDLVMGVKVVDALAGAVAHIRRYTSGHTEAIVTEDLGAAKEFVAHCPAAVVMVNASTRFTDGAEFGFGAEIGNSTQRLHARGPMGVRELTTYRIEVWGEGQVRE